MMDRESIEALVLKEAGLLDRMELEAWLELFTADAEYWVPVLAEQDGPEGGLSIMHDSRAMMEARVHRLRHHMAHAQQPASRCARLIGNITLDQSAGDAATVRSVLMLVEYRADRQFVHAAQVEHRLISSATGLRIRRKRVDLVNSEASHEMISIPF